MSNRMILLIISLLFLPFGIRGVFSQILIDSLNTGSKGEVIGGEFDSLGGWTAKNWIDFIRYDLGKYYSSGRFTINVRNFDPPNQNSAARHHILSMYADSIGDHNHWSYNTGDSTEKSVWNLHTGDYYNGGLKLLSIVGEKIQICREDLNNWNPNTNYQFTVSWQQDTVTFYIDSVLVVQNTHLQNFCLRYIFIGRDYTHSLDIETGLPDNEYPPQIGPVYSNLVVYGDSVVPEIYPDQLLHHPVNLPEEGNIFSFDVDIKYNPELLELDSIERNIEDINLFYNDEPGSLKIGVYSTHVINKRDSVLNVHFMTHPDSSEVRFSHLRYTRFLVNANPKPSCCYSYIINPFDSSISVPVELSSFDVLKIDPNSVKLNWSTESEEINYGFEVQRANENKKFRKIGFVKGEGTTSKSSSYEFTDRNLDEGIYRYRLKQIDYNGSFTFSGIKEVTIGQPKKLELYENYPNPFLEKTHIPFSIPHSLNKSNSMIDIYDIRGRLIQSYSLNRRENQKEIIWNGTNKEGFRVPSGIYFCILKANNSKIIRKLLFIR